VSADVSHGDASCWFLPLCAQKLVRCPTLEFQGGAFDSIALPLITNGDAAGRVALGLVYNLGRGIGSFRGATEQN
jgi:hypothetical protein